jgi:nitroreductase
MNTIDSLKWRYATKMFDANKPLTKSHINTLKEAFNLTATSFGLQPVSLIMVENKEIQRQLVAHSWNQEQVAQAPLLLVLCIPKEYKISEVEKYFKLVKEIRNTPEEVLNPFKEFLLDDIAKKNQEELFLWNKNQAYLAMGNLLTVCALEQIDSCPMEGFVPDKYDEILNLKKQNLTSVLVLPVGFRAEDCFMKDLEKVRKKTQDCVIEIS